MKLSEVLGKTIADEHIGTGLLDMHTKFGIFTDCLRPDFITDTIDDRCRKKMPMFSLCSGQCLIKLSLQELESVLINKSVTLGTRFEIDLSKLQVETLDSLNDIEPISSVYGVTLIIFESVHEQDWASNYRPLDAQIILFIDRVDYNLAVLYDGTAKRFKNDAGKTWSPEELWT